MADDGLLDTGIKVRCMTLPDEQIKHDDQAKQYDYACLTALHIVDLALGVLGVEAETQTGSDAAKPARA